MAKLEDRLTMTLKNDIEFQKDLRGLLVSRGYAESEAQAALELLLRGMRDGPVESGLSPKRTLQQ